MEERWIVFERKNDKLTAVSAPLMRQSADAFIYNLRMAAKASKKKTPVEYELHKMMVDWKPQ